MRRLEDRSRWARPGDRGARLPGARERRPDEVSDTWSKYYLSQQLEKSNNNSVLKIFSAFKKPIFYVVASLSPGFSHLCHCRRLGKYVFREIGNAAF